jgi:hypothetical protein
MVLSPDNISGFLVVTGSSLSIMGPVWGLAHMILPLKICKNPCFPILGELLIDSTDHNGVMAKHPWDLELITFKNKTADKTKKKWVFLRVSLQKLFFSNSKKVFKKIWNYSCKALTNLNL